MPVYLTSYPEFYQTWTEVSYDQKIVSTIIFFIVFPSFLLSLQLAAKVGETLSSGKTVIFFITYRFNVSEYFINKKGRISYFSDKCFEQFH